LGIEDFPKVRICHDCRECKGQECNGQEYKGVQRAGVQRRSEKSGGWDEKTG